MKNFSGYIKTLLLLIGKNDILTNVGDIKYDINDTIIPKLNAFKNYYNEHETASVKVNVVVSNFFTISKVRSNSQNIYAVLDIIIKTIETINKNISKLETLVENNFEADIFSDALNAKNASIIMIIDSLTFLINYTIQLLAYLAIMEERAISNNMDSGSEIFPKAVLEIFNSQFMNYVQLINYFYLNENVFNDLNKITEIPIDVNDNTNYFINESMRNAPSIKKYPITNNFIGNPIYHFRLAIADWQVHGYNKKKEYKTLLEYRLLDLKNRQNGVENPKLQSQIEYYENRIHKIEKDIREVEENARRP